MTLHPAIQRSTIRSPIARALARRAHVVAANDNLTADVAANPELFDAALRFFGKHGLGAASEARRLAEAAFFANDRAGYDYWLGICQILDRRLASRAAKAIAQAKTRPLT